MSQTTSQSITALDAWLNGTNTGAKDQITRTIYDEPYPGTDNIYIKQENLRNRVSYSQVWNNAANQYAASATYYSYDIHGNVEVLLQDFGHQSQQNAMNVTYNRFKTIRYDYDLVSGKVNQVMYQPSYYNASMQQVVRNADAFYHRYTYDVENKLTSVWTSRDSVYWEQDADYSYYKHGPLSRSVVGKLKVQGPAYSYTLKG